jgi:hypothetical protein
MDAEVSDFEVLIILSALVFGWLLPILIIIRSNKTTGSEKLAWVLIVFFISWFAWIFYMLLAPIKRSAEPSTKSQLVGFLFTLGPLGLFYSSFLAGFTLLTIMIAVGLYTQRIETLAVWPICIIVSFFTVHSHNSRIDFGGYTQNLNRDSNSERVEPKL